MPAGSDAATTRDLRRNVPRMFLELADRKVAAAYLLFGLAPLYLTLLSGNGFVLIAAGPIGPLLTVGFLLIRPPNPYKSLYARLANLEDADARAGRTPARLVTLLRSREAKILVVRTGMGCSIAVIILMVSMAYLRRSAIDWSLDPWPMTMISLLWALWSLALQYHFLMRWVLRRWHAERTAT